MDQLEAQRITSLLQTLRSSILHLWPCQSLELKLDPLRARSLVIAESCSPPHCVEREHEPAPYVLRRQMVESVTPCLRTLAAHAPEAILLYGRGAVYRRDRSGNLLQSHEAFFWRLSAEDVPLRSLDDLIALTADRLPRGMRLRTRPLAQSYLVYGLALEAYCAGWKGIGQCGILNPMLLIENGWDPMASHGLVLSLDLDRMVQVQDQWETICLRRGP